MAMLRTCSFPGCAIFTLLSPYCIEHEQVIATLDVERALLAGDEPRLRKLAEVAQPAVAAAPS